VGRNGYAARVKAWARGAARAIGPDGALGLTAATLVGVGVWGLHGWAWAFVSLGAPLGAFYMYAEARKLGGTREE
jgi:hypothetical protein